MDVAGGVLRDVQDADMSMIGNTIMVMFPENKLLSKSPEKK